jgi:hypothetical protein
MFHLIEVLAANLGGGGGSGCAGGSGIVIIAYPS